ncbi:MAG: hypothetical protein H6934_07680 [Burkholderiaceae bacterium]|nr:hypothetical protein [Burkholderiaceae bacterium]
MSVTVTPEAAARILQAFDDSEQEEPLLRVAGRLEDGQPVFGMGFDERRDQDTEFSSEGVVVLVSPPSLDWVQGLTIDFVELPNGDARFVFVTPSQP